MNLFEAIVKIRTVRKFLDKPVDEKFVGLILYMATQALSAGNLQGWEFVVVEDDETKNKLASAALKLEHIKRAPLDIVVCADLGKAALKYGKRGELVYALEDSAYATMLMILTANALGLGTDLVRAFDEDEVKGILNLPDNLRPVAIIPIGYPAEEGEKLDRIPFENITYVNRYGNKIEIEFKSIYEIFKKLKGKAKRISKK